MTKIILAFDDEDDIMGEFNRGCQEDYQLFLADYDYPTSTINTAQLNDLNIQLQTTNVNHPFIFVAYSHGQNEGLYARSEAYVSTSINNTCFTQSFFYTVSCHAADSLGTCLIENGCFGFFGYKSLFNFWVGYKSFSHCANYGFFLFLQGQDTKAIYNAMIEEYNNHIDQTYSESALVASLLLDNRRALIYKGQNITIANLLN